MSTDPLDDAFGPVVSDPAAPEPEPVDPERVREIQERLRDRMKRRDKRYQGGRGR